MKGKRLTLSLEPSEIRAVVSRGPRILRWGSAPLPAGVLRQGEVLRPDVFGQVVAELVESLKAPRQHAIVGLGSQRVLVRFLSLPPVPARMLDEAIRREARREFPLPVESLYLFWQILTDQPSARSQVFTVGIPKEIVDTSVMALRSARIRPVAMDIKPLALVRGANLSDGLLVDLEEGLASLVLVRDFIPLAVRAIPLTTEKMWVDQLLGEIQRTLDFYRAAPTANLPPGPVNLCLTGALGASEEVRARLREVGPLVEPVLPIPVPQGMPLLTYLGNIGLMLKRLP